MYYVSDIVTFYVYCIVFGYIRLLCVYWNVLFSWGPGFGTNGYFLLARNRSNTCGVAHDATFGTGWVQVAAGAKVKHNNGVNQRTTVSKLTCVLVTIIYTSIY